MRYPVIKKEIAEYNSALGKEGINRSSKAKGLARNYRSFTILRDFHQYYEDKDFNQLEPVNFGNGLGAGGLDSVFFGHMAKNWRYGKTKIKRFMTEKKKKTLAE